MTEKSYNFHTETQTAIFCIEENSIEEMGDNSTSWWETKFICGIATIISSVLGSKAFLLLCVTCVFCTVSTGNAKKWKLVRNLELLEVH